jgi:hypothetical protein
MYALRWILSPRLIILAVNNLAAQPIDLWQKKSQSVTFQMNKLDTNFTPFPLQFSSSEEP